MDNAFSKPAAGTTPLSTDTSAMPPPPTGTLGGRPGPAPRPTLSLPSAPPTVPNKGMIRRTVPPVGGDGPRPSAPPQHRRR